MVQKFHEKAKIVGFFMNLLIERSCYHISIVPDVANNSVQVLFQWVRGNTHVLEARFGAGLVRVNFKSLHSRCIVHFRIHVGVMA